MGKLSTWQQFKRCMKPLDWTRFIDETDVEVANIVTCHGMGRMYLVGGVVRRTIWVFLVTLCMAVCLWQVVERIKMFLTYPLKTDISIKYMDSLVFPAVTICNLNSFSSRSLNELDRLLINNISYSLVHELKASARIKASPAKTREMQSEILARYVQNEQRFLELFDVKDFQTDQWLHEKSWQLTDDVLKCSFGGRKCTAANFESTFTRAGRCYTFRGFDGETLVQQTAGTDGGLELIINIEQEDYTPFTLFGNYQIEAGIKVIIQPTYEPPDSNLAILSMPGYSAFIPISLTSYSTFNEEPWNKCNSETTTLEPPYDTYSAKTCQAICEATLYLNQCGCNPWFLGSFNETDTLCGVARTTYCLVWEIDESERDDCVAQCLPACETNIYDIDATYSKFPSKAAFEGVKESLQNSSQRGFNVTIDQMRSNWLSVTVFFEDMFYISDSTSEAYDIPSFLADLGGQFNLFAGFSVLTYCELIEYIIIKMWRKSRVILRKGDKKKTYTGAVGQAVTTKYLPLYKSALLKPDKNSMLQRLATIVSSNIERQRSVMGLPREPLPQIVQNTISAASGDRQPGIVVPTLESDDEDEDLYYEEVTSSPRQPRRLSRNISRHLVSSLERRVQEMRSTHQLSTVEESTQDTEIDDESQ